MTAVVAVALVALVGAVPAQAAGTWSTTRSTAPGGTIIESDLHDTFFLPDPDADTGWAVGRPLVDGANVRHCWFTSDSGAIWNPQTVGDVLAVPQLALSEMETVYFRNINLGWTGGQYGIISKCTDGVAGTWAVKRVGTGTQTIQDIFAISDTDVWAAGVDTGATDKPILLHSTDGGETWFDLDIACIHFADANNGWAVGSRGAILHTVNKGATWSIQTGGTTNDLNAVFAVSATEAWAAGASGTILHTIDSGTTWTSDFGANAVFSLDATNTWVGGQNGLLMHYDGTKWTKQNGNTISDIRGIHFADAGYGWAVGEGSVNLVTANGGANWAAGPAPGAATDFNDVAIVDAGPAYSVFTCGDSGRFYYTSDAKPGGAPAPWATALVPPPAQDLKGIDYSDLANGVIAGSAGTLASTTDGGANWANSPSGGTTDFTDVTYGNSPDCWFATAVDGAIWMTRSGSSGAWAPLSYNDVSMTATDEPEHYAGNSGLLVSRDGATWTAQNSGTSVDLAAVEFYDSAHGWAVGPGDTVLCTENGGTGWTAIPTGTGGDWNDVCVRDDGTGDYLVEVVGENSAIAYGTMDFLLPPVWNTPSSIPGVVRDLNGVDFRDENAGWAVGESGTVWQTINGGADWDVVNFYDVATIGGDDSYFVGDGGTIVHWTPASQGLELCYNAGSWTTATLRGVYFADATNGWAVGDDGTVIRCTNAAAGTWDNAGQVPDPGGGRPNLDAVYLSSADAGFAVGDAGYYTQLTAGPTWSVPAQVGGVNPNLNDICLSAADTGFAVGDSGYYTELTAGPAWSVPAQVGAPNPNLNSIWLTAADAGFAVGDSGYHTELSAGPAWTAPAQVGGANPNLYDVAYPASTDGWAVGGDGAQGYRVPVTSGTYGAPVGMGANTSDLTGVAVEPGATYVGFASGLNRTIASYNVTTSGWVVDAQIPTNAGTFNSISLESGSTAGWVVGQGGMAYMMNSGVLWAWATGTATDINDVSVNSITSAFAVGDDSTVLRWDGDWTISTQPDGYDYQGVALLNGWYATAVGGMNNVRHTDDGTVWTGLSVIGETTDDFLSLDFPTAASGWFSGENGILFRYTGGRMEQLTSGTIEDLRSVSLYDDSEGFAVGERRTILEGSAPDTWSIVSEMPSGTQAINAISFPAVGDGWFAGDNGFILGCEGGAFVQQDAGGTAEDYRGISLTLDGAVYKGAAVGTNGAVRYTADSGSTWANADPGTAADLNSIDMVSPGRVILCGDYDAADEGTVRVSVDAGATWTTPIAPPDMTGNHQDLMSVSISDVANDWAWVAGTGGALFSASSAGLPPYGTWNAQPTGIGQDLNSLCAQYDGGVPDYLLFVAGPTRTIQMSADAGTGWTPQSYVPAPSMLNGGAAVDANNIYFSGVHTGVGGLVAHTTNGGVTLTPEVDGGGVPQLNGMTAIAANAVWAAGNGLLLFWNGAAWAPMAGLPAVDYNDITVENVGGSNHGVVVGDAGAIFFTANADVGGWAGAASLNTNDLESACLRGIGLPNSVVYAVGPAGTIIGSVSSGATWNFLRGPANQLNGTSFIDANNGWAVGAEGTILVTADGGTTWTKQASGTLEDLYAVRAIDANNVYAVGNAGTVLFFNGAAWGPVGGVGTGENLRGVWATDTSNVWVVGANGTIRYWDGGVWTDQDVGGGIGFNAVCATDATHAWAAGDGGVIYFYGGLAWVPQTSGTTADLFAITAPDATHLWASGAGGVVVGTANGGTDWSDRSASVGADLRGVKFIDDVNGFAVGSYEFANEPAVAVYTTNGGVGWTEMVTQTSQGRTLRAIDGKLSGSNWVFYAAGDWGAVQKMTNAVALPSITPPLVPAIGTVGSGPVVINGAGFGPDQGTVDGHVFFNGGAEPTGGEILAWGVNQIQVTVPSGAYGFQQGLRVVTSGGSSNEVDFTVVPSVTGATSPVTGGALVTIDGEGFGPDPGAGNRSTPTEHVTVGGTQIPDAAVGSWDNTQIEIDLPDDVPPGAAVGVTVTSGDATNTSAPFNITVNPTLDPFVPPSARPGDAVTITGTNFGADPGAGNRHSASFNVTMNTSAGPQIVDEPSAWGPESITFTVPYTAGVFEPRTGNVTVTGESQTSNARQLTILPRVDALLPAPSGAVGASITVQGACFGAPQGAGVVRFNGTLASSYTSWVDDQIVAVVPNAPVTRGTMRVTTVDGDSNELPFDVLATLTSLSSPWGRVGDTLTLNGTGFGSPQGVGTVTISGAEATPSNWAVGSITVTVPNDATTGAVIVTTQTGDSGALPYTVRPKITGIDPASGVPGETVVTISGFTFGATQGINTVMFNGLTAGAAQSWSPNTIKVTVPAGATSGDVIVTTADGDSNAMPFTTGPVIDSITPEQGPPTGLVTVAGDNFKGTQGTSTVTFDGVDAGEADSWSDTEIDIQVPYGAETGDVVVTTAEGASNPVTFEVGLSRTYYFAEGTTRANFEEWLCLMNPGDTDTLVNITYMLGTGQTVPQQVLVSKTSRLTLFVPDAVGANQDVSIKVDSAAPIMAERPMYFNYGGVWTGGHDVVGAIAPAGDWYFAEGNTRDGFDEYLCIQNPGAQPAAVQITYMLPGGENKVQNINVSATSRQTVNVKSFLGSNKDCSALVHSDVGIIAERPMYFIYRPDTLRWTGGHDVIGANAPGEEWFFAEGTTRTGFDEWLCLQNPGATPANVTIKYMLETGEVKTQLQAVEAHSRRTVDVVTFVGRGRDVSMHVTSDAPIVAERPMYFDYVGLTGGSDVIGSTCSVPYWYFAEGATQAGFQEWLSLQNPGDTDTVATITYMLGKGAPIETQVTVKAHSRTTVDVNTQVGWGKDCSARVTAAAGGSIIVERPMYFDQHGWTGGHDVIGFHY